ncbi:MAG: UDP-glucose/GDP-mannose dehydrogenase family protein, partial [Brucellaceae bacterium]|nr:UDP-glucose/GDP-mannose dehydrogenase family protein [Brucellaceae bacterium]
MGNCVSVTVIGCGYVGLVSGVCLADWGHDVTLVDQNENRISMLKEGAIPIYEPGLDALLAACRDRGRICFSSDLAASVPDARCIMIAVGTPSDPLTGDADLSQVLHCAREIAGALSGGGRYTVVVKSTVPPGTCERVEHLIRDLRPDVEVHVASNPEFLREGSAIDDFQNPDRVVFGVHHDHARETMEKLYEPLARRGTRIIVTDCRSSETTKYASNAFLATKIAFVNQLADLCEALGANIKDVIAGTGSDSRIGSKFLEPGPGYGGSCFPKDTMALRNSAREVGVDLSIVAETINANDIRKRSLANRIRLVMGGSLEGRRIAILGLTFKAETDDLRDSPALSLAHALVTLGARVTAYDPQVAAGRDLMEGLAVMAGPYECAANAEALVVATEWAEFRRLDLRRLASVMGEARMFDFRRHIDPEAARAAGFIHHRIGEHPATEEDAGFTHALAVADLFEQPETMAWKVRHKDNSKS